MPCLIFKTNEVNENEVNPKFFINAAIDKATSDGIKHNHIMQRYISSKGFVCSIIRAVLSFKDNGQQFIKVFKISGKYRYDGENVPHQERALNEKKIKEIVEGNNQFLYLRKAISKLKKKLNKMDLSVSDFFKNKKNNEELTALKDENFHH